MSPRPKMRAKTRNLRTRYSVLGGREGTAYKIIWTRYNAAGRPVASGRESRALTPRARRELRLSSMGTLPRSARWLYLNKGKRYRGVPASKRLRGGKRKRKR